jgi:hypothetical protein
MKLWVVGQNKFEGPDGIVWELGGVFSTEALAVEACRSQEYFVFPVELNEQLPEESIVAPGCYYPKA